MNYVILHGTLNNIEKGEICDGAIWSSYMEGHRDTPWNYRKSFTEDAEHVLWDGNYFSEEDDGINNSSWTEEKRNLVHDRWLGLIDIIDKQLKEKGRFDIEFINYFSNDSSDSYKEILFEKIRRFMKDVEKDIADTKSITEMMDILEDY